jgi:hypothetical protein
MWKRIICALALGFLTNAWAGPYDPIITKPWVGESVPGQTSATLQLDLTTVKPVSLISISSPAAESIEIHSLTRGKDGIKVRVMPTLPLADHSTTLFGMRGLFLMMNGLKQPLVTGERIPVTLTFAFADKQTKSITVTAEIKKMDLSYKNFGPKEIYQDRR